MAYCSIVDTSIYGSIVENLILKYYKGFHYAFGVHSISLHSSAYISAVVSQVVPFPGFIVGFFVEPFTPEVDNMECRKEIRHLFRGKE
jgi:hypothetical protein